MTARQRDDAAEESTGADIDANPARGGGVRTDATPSMAQYLEIKAANPDSLLWYRMGDFYELFFADAVTAAQALSITLTKRGKHQGEDIPMCGVPVIRADEYLQRLIRQGYRVAVCEQLEDPAQARKRGSKAVVRRDVVRLVTPGTLTEDTLLDARARNYLTAVFAIPAPGGAGAAEPGFALASLDISTGEFEVGVAASGDLAGEIVRLSPGEIIHGDVAPVGEIEAPARQVGAALTPVPSRSFDSLSGEHALKQALGVADLAAFGAFSRPELSAIAALLRYVELTQIGLKPVVRPPRRTGSGRLLLVDAATRASLELVRSTSGERQGSLLAAMDRTVTGAGSRELAARIASPLCDVAEINARLDAVDDLVRRERLREGVRGLLRGAGDISRALSRLSLQRGGPKDLAGVRDGLATAFALGEALAASSRQSIDVPAALADIATRLLAVRAGPDRPADDDLAALLAAALIPDPPAQKRDGGYVRAGYSSALDEARALRDDSRRVLAELEARYVAETGVRGLKVRHNNILGYFLETTQQAAKPLLEPPLGERFLHRQTMANAVRFTTVELSEIEGRLASAAERALQIEAEVFADLTSRILAKAEALAATASAIGELDCLAGLAELAASERYVRPIVDDSRSFAIRGGRHPVVEQALAKAKAQAFVANDCVLQPPDSGSGIGIGIDETHYSLASADHPPGFDETIPPAAGRIWLVTGPNMAGKSTFLRQNALIALMAQAGSFVPAQAARIGALDRLFSRVGASDDLARGRSTFMVEMVETAAILNAATDRSLVVLDEIGRGTATFDGLSIAWATVEHLHDVNRSRALFATHYHELTQLAGRLPDVVNVTVRVSEWQDDIVFLHEVRAGAANRSYGIQVGKLAGLPASVVQRASEVLSALESGQQRGAAGTPLAELEDLPLFAAGRRTGELGSALPPPQHPTGTATGRRRRSAATTAQVPTPAPPPSPEPPPPPHPLLATLATIHPDELTPRDALDLIYRLKALAKGEP